jgi:hypothetical protein
VVDVKGYENCNVGLDGAPYFNSLIGRNAAAVVESTLGTRLIYRSMTKISPKHR